MRQAPKRVKKYLEGAPAFVAAIYDNGGKSADRYTVCYTRPIWSEDYVKANIRCGRSPWLVPMRSMSENPFHSQGVGLFVEGIRGNHLGKLIHWCDLPSDCQRCVIQDSEES